MIQRRSAKVVRVGDLFLGGNYPIRVQSMTSTPTEDVPATLQQIRQLYEAHCEIVRVTVPNRGAVEALAQITKQLREDHIDVPVVADVHFSPSIALACVPYADKIRINPGNFHDNWEMFRALLKSAKEQGKAIRIGVNQGSLSSKILETYGHSTEAMYQSLLPFLQIADSETFTDIVLSFKSSNVPSMVAVNRELVQKLDDQGWNFPVHLGVTEAGNNDSGRIKGALGIGSLVLDGIGDTLRVSLTENPVNEVTAGYTILQASGRRITQTEYIACPGCGRTQFNLQNVLNEIKEKTGNFPGLRIAVMGCAVNGLGELKEADYGCIGSNPEHVNLYAHGECISRNIPEGNIATEVSKLIKLEKFLKSHNLDQN